MSKPLFLRFVILAIIIKLSLFAYVEFFAPQSIYKFDSHDYLRTAETLIKEGAFFRFKDNEGLPIYEKYRTPGYPLFLGVLRHVMVLPVAAIIFIQILLTVLAAFFCYKTAMLIAPRLSYVSALIILFDPPITIYSMIILTETLFLVLMTVFMYTMVRFLKERRWRDFLVAAVTLAVSAYVRPVSIAAGGAVFLFFVYLAARTRQKSFLIDGLVFLLFVYALLLPWYGRNHQHFGQWTFSSIAESTVHSDGVWRSYSRNKDKLPVDQGPVIYYMSVVSKSMVSLMTRPGTLKDLGSMPLKWAGKLFAYPFMAFWLIGLLVGIGKMRQEITLQFMAVMILYFMAISVGGGLLSAGSRFRVPMMPFIAILSAHGFNSLKFKVES